MTNQEIYTMFRNQEKYLKFTEFLDSLEEKCYSCDESCGNPWCPYTKEEEE